MRRFDWDKLLLQDRLHERMTSGQIAAHLRTNRSAVNRALARRGLTAKAPVRALADWDHIINVQQLHHTHSPEALAERFGAAVSTVKRRIWEREGSVKSKNWT